MWGGVKRRVIAAKDGRGAPSRAQHMILNAVMELIGEPAEIAGAGSTVEPANLGQVLSADWV